MCVPQFPRRIARAILLAIAAAGRADHGSAQEIGRYFGDWFPSARAGLHTQVLGAAQDGSGRIFVGHVSGLHHFDGRTWARVEGASLCRSVREIAPGEIYAGTDDGPGRVWERAPGHFVFEPLAAKWEEGLTGRVSQVVSADDGAVYFRAEEHLLRLLPDRLPDDPAAYRLWQGEGKEFLFAGNVGARVVIQSARRGLLEVIGDELVEIPATRSLNGTVVMGIVPRSDDRWLVFTAAHGLRVLGSDLRPPDARLAEFVAGGTVRGVCPLPAGGLAVGSRAGVALVDDRDRVLRIVRSIEGSPVLSMEGPPFLDREGGLWVPAVGGVARIEVGSCIEKFHAVREAPEVVHGLQRHDDVIYVATEHGLFALEASPQGQPFQLVHRAFEQRVYSLLVFQEALMIGAQDGTYEMLSDGSFERIREGPGYCLAASPGEETLYIASRGAVSEVHWDGEEWSRREATTPVHDVTGMVVAGVGGVWLSGVSRSLDSILGRWEPGGAVVELGGDRGVPATVSALVEWQGDVLLGTPEGFRRCAEGSDLFEPYAELDAALAPLGIWATNLAVDWSGALWGWLEEGHLFRVRDGPEGLRVDTPLARAHPDDVTCFHADGMDTVWVSTVGAQIFRHRERAGALAPLLLPRIHVLLEPLESPRVVPLAALEGLDARSCSLRFEFVLPSFEGAECNRYRTRIAGMSDEWSAWAAEPYRDVMNVPPGQYRFEVEGRDVHGRVSPRGSLAFRALAPWYRTAWAWTLWLLLGLAGVVGLTSLRTRLARRRVAALEKEVCERQRAEAALRLEAEEHRRTSEERGRLEVELRESQKMEAIGLLAGGIAHDFNNILTAIFGEVDVARGLMGSQPVARGLRQSLDQIRFAADRASELIRQLLAYSRRQTLQSVAVDVARRVNGLRGMLRRVLRENILLDFEIDEEATYIRIDPGQLEQMVLNLVVNASEAMPGGGRIVVRVLAHQRPEEFFPELDAGPFVLIEVQDTGAGMDRETVGRIFEPFFTTKSAGGGTGLGLASVYGIVRQSGGRIAVESEPGAGSTFRVLLPQIEPEVCTTLVTPKGPRPELKGMTILLCDDNEPVRRVARMILDQVGVCVLEADGPMEALRLARQHDGPIELLISDVVMPVMSGPELHRQLTPLRGRLPVLFVSGYPANELPFDLTESDDIHFLSKPFTKKLLLEATLQVLGEVPRHVQDAGRTPDP